MPLTVCPVQAGCRGVGGLLAELPAGRGQDRGASGVRPAVDELPAAGAFEQDDLVVEGGKRVKPGHATPRRAADDRYLHE